MAKDFSDAYKKILEDHRNYEINNTLRYNFVHNGYNCLIFHASESSMTKVLTVVVEINDTLYPFALQMNDITNVPEYIPSEVFSHIKQIIKLDYWKTAPFFNHIKLAILNNYPVTDRVDIEGERYYHYREDDYKPYFWRFSRVNLSETMKKKLNEKYSPEFSRKLISFCMANRVTTCFTSDINKAKDIEMEMDFFKIYNHYI